MNSVPGWWAAGGSACCRTPGRGSEKCPRSSFRGGRNDRPGALRGACRPAPVSREGFSPRYPVGTRFADRKQDSEQAPKELGARARRPRLSPGRDTLCGYGSRGLSDTAVCNRSCASGRVAVPAVTPRSRPAPRRPLRRKACARARARKWVDARARGCSARSHPLASARATSGSTTAPSGRDREPCLRRVIRAASRGSLRPASPLHAWAKLDDSPGPPSVGQSTDGYRRPGSPVARQGTGWKRCASGVSAWPTRATRPRSRCPPRSRRVSVADPAVPARAARPRSLPLQSPTANRPTADAPRARLTASPPTADRDPAIGAPLHRGVTRRRSAVDGREPHRRLRRTRPARWHRPAPVCAYHLVTGRPPAVGRSRHRLRRHRRHGQARPRSHLHPVARHPPHTRDPQRR